LPLDPYLDLQAVVRRCHGKADLEDPAADVVVPLSADDLFVDLVDLLRLRVTPACTGSGSDSFAAAKPIIVERATLTAIAAINMRVVIWASSPWIALTLYRALATTLPNLDAAEGIL
jgi:hypothetical protein